MQTSWPSPSPLRLLVIDSQRATTHRLEQGTVTIGRAERCAVRLDDDRVASEQLRLHVDDDVRIEALGRAVPVAGTLLEPGVPAPWRPGVPIVLGGATLVLQQAPTAPRLRHIRSQDYFEARLEEEVARADAAGPPHELSVVRVKCGRSDVAKLEQEFVRQLRACDVVGAYGPEEYQILFLDLPRRAVDAAVDRLVANLRRVDVDVDASVVSFPRDARTAEGLLAAAGAPRPRLPTEPPGGASSEEAVAPIARGGINVVVSGETGAGKERLAHTIHRLSPRRDRPFVCINCAALNDSLLESELFGTEKGAFTGATHARAGLLESADGGTVFLDEVGEMTPALQAKMLRVIEQREVLRVGAVRPRAIDVRFVSATNRDLEADVEAGRFRADLYFRLNGVTLTVAPLRARTGEIPALVEGFARGFAAAGGPVPTFSPEVLDLFARYRWPGNIRELRNVVERAVLVCRGNVVTLADVPAEKMSRRLAGLPTARRPEPEPPPPPPPQPAERERIVEALLACGGNQSHAATRLGVSRRTLIDRIERYGLPRPRKRPAEA